MASRNIYSGCVAVAAADYVHNVRRGDDEVIEEEMQGLDERISRSAELHFTLEYPFEKPFEGVVIGDAGVTLRQIIDAIRHGFRTMYREASHEPIANLLNVRVEGEYGLAYHAIDDLVIEIIDLDEETGQLNIAIGS